MVLLADGAGGKGTWGKLLDTDDDCFLDKNDPNYDSGEVLASSIQLILFFTRRLIHWLTCDSYNREHMMNLLIHLHQTPWMITRSL